MPSCLKSCCFFVHFASLTRNNRAYVLRPSVLQLSDTGQIASYIVIIISQPSQSYTKNSKDLQRILQMLINLQNRRLITTPIAIIRCRENRHHIPILAPIIPFHHQLMRPRHKRQPIVVVKRLGYVLSECVPCAPRRYTPSTTIVGVAPE